MKTLLLTLCLVASAAFSQGLLPPTPTTNAHVVDVANQVKADSLAFAQSCAARLVVNINACWSDPLHTPQQFLAQFGTSAGAAMAMNNQLYQLVTSYEAASGMTLYDHAVMAKVKAYTVNSDGTVTVTGN